MATAPSSHAADAVGTVKLRSYRWLALLPVPVLLVLLGLVVSAWMGPFWIYPRSDPDYPYLLNGLNIVQGRGPWHVDHPGTTVHMLIGGVIAVAHTLTNWAGGADPSMRRDVIARPEFYLLLSHLAILLAAAGSSVALGLVALRASRSLACAICTQVMCIATMAMVAALIRVNAEPMLLVIAMLLGAVAIHVSAQSLLHAGKEESDAGDDAPNLRPRQIRWSILLGIIVALGIVTKITFAPAGLIALAAVRGLRQWIVLALATATTLFLATSPIWSRWEYIKTWVWKNTKGTYRYGMGEQTFIDLTKYPGHLLANLKFEPAFTALMVASIIAIAVVTFAPAAASDRTRRLRTLLLGIVGAQIVIVLVMSKASQPRYLVPAMAFMGPAFCITWMLAASIHGRLFARTLTSALTLGVVATTAWAGWRLAEWRPELLCLRERALHASDVTASYDHAIIAHFPYGTSSEAFSLLFGCDWAGGSRYNKLVLERFPNHMMWNGPSWAYNGRDHITTAQIIEWTKEGRLLARGEPWGMPDDMTIEPIIELHGLAGHRPAGLNALGSTVHFFLARGETLYYVRMREEMDPEAQ